MRASSNTRVIEWDTRPAESKRRRRIYCVINCLAGSAADIQRETLHQAFAEHGRDYEVESIIEVCARPKSLTQIVRQAIASGADVIAAGGGDGTISTVANQLAGTGVALGVLPLGTLNHFAKDIGIPLDLRDAVKVVCRGAIKRVDVGEVNGFYFINNSSLGVYPEMARVRERWRPLLGKWLALAVGAIAMLRRFPALNLSLDIDGWRLRRRVPLLFVGNNAYSVEWPDLGGRERLDEGGLSLWLVREASRLALLRSAFSLLLGRLHLAPEIEASRVESLTVKPRRRRLRRLRVAVDGEVIKLRPPLRYRIRPQSLNVCVPTDISFL
ncbi:MAG TPA: diacylglycerol kinase family protein [Blastocatellia bacterium]